MANDHNTTLTVLPGGTFPGHRAAAPNPWLGGGMDTIVHVVGARPNFVKMAPVIMRLRRDGREDVRVLPPGSIDHCLTWPCATLASRPTTTWI